MRAEVSGAGETVVIRLHGSFTFEAHGAFSAAIEKATTRNSREIQLDLSGVKDVNSAGLGMLLILLSKARNSGKFVSVAPCPGAVGDAIEMAGFHKLFGVASDKLPHLAAHQGKVSDGAQVLLCGRSHGRA